MIWGVPQGYPEIWIWHKQHHWHHQPLFHVDLSGKKRSWYQSCFIGTLWSSLCQLFNFDSKLNELKPFEESPWTMDHSLTCPESYFHIAFHDFPSGMITIIQHISVISHVYLNAIFWGGLALLTDRLLIGCRYNIAPYSFQISLQFISNYYTGWWFEPLWKILVNWDHYSQYMGK